MISAGAPLKKKRATNRKLKKYRPHNSTHNGSAVLKCFAEASKDEKQIVIKITKPIPCSGFPSEGEIVTLVGAGGNLSLTF
jgi:hypothetical protein